MKKRNRNDERPEPGASLEDQVRRLQSELRKSRKRRVSTPAAAVRTVEPAAPPPDDDQLFRSAIADVQSLPERTVRVATKPSLEQRSRSDPTPAGTDFCADDLFDVRFSDLFIRGRASGVSRETVDRLARGELAVRSHVDLHGMALDDAKKAVDQFLVERQRRGDRCVLVITGKGKNSPGQVAVLRERIPEWLARGPSSRRVLAFVTARPCDGGEGALYVLLRKDASRKIRIDVEAGSGE
jgi:DNA-nicking Smr family endonuclease